MIETAEPLVIEPPELRTAKPDRPWQVAYVVTRHEKAVAQELNRRSVECFLPTYHATHYWNKRRALVELPLFASYVFVRMNRHERLRVLQVPAVVQLVTFNGVPASIPAEEIDALRAAVRMGRAQPHAYFSLGDRLRIKAGPLKGLEGILVREKNASRMIVNVDFISRSVSVELEPNDLEGVPR